MIDGSPSDRRDDRVAGQAAASVIGGIALLLAIAILLVVLYAHGYSV
jgi:hypothetical protein